MKTETKRWYNIPIFQTVFSLAIVAAFFALYYGKYHIKNYFSPVNPVFTLLSNAGEDPECENIFDHGDVCAFVSDACNGRLFNYLAFRYCSLDSISKVSATAVCVLIFSIWMYVLILCLGSTADTFFIPALTLISKELNLSDAVAGLTLLSLGNGAPDIFSSISSIKSDIQLVFGGLFGASVCISMLVLGCAVYSAETKISASTFWRNILGYLVCMVVVFVIFLNRQINLYISFVFIGIYVVYVIVSVIYLQYLQRIKNKLDKEERLVQSRLLRQASLNALSSPLLENDMNFGQGENIVDDGLFGVPLDNLAGNDEVPPEEEDDVDHATFLEGVTYPHPDWEDKKGVSLIFAKVNYFLEFPFFVLRWLTIPSTHIRADEWGTIKKVLGLFCPIPLSILFCFNLYEHGDFDKSSTVRLFFIICMIGVFVSILSTIYYFYVVIPRSTRYTRRRNEMRGKADELTLQANENHDDTIDALVLHWNLDKDDSEAQPLTLRIFQVYISALGFLGSICWLSVVADEVVQILEAVGYIFSISPTIMGVSVLAIGNSTPDLISNVALVKVGQSETALASMFGAPLLTTLLGLGIGSLMECSTHYPTPIKFTINTQVLITFIFIFVASISHMIVFWKFNYSPPRLYGMFLIISYLAFLVAMVIMEIV